LETGKKPDKLADYYPALATSFRAAKKQIFLLLFRLKAFKFSREEELSFVVLAFIPIFNARNGPWVIHCGLKSHPDSYIFSVSASMSNYNHFLNSRETKTSGES
jgi:hypothetical protein